MQTDLEQFITLNTKWNQPVRLDLNMRKGISGQRLQSNARSKYSGTGFLWVTREMAHQNVRHYLNLLNRRVLGLGSRAVGKGVHTFKCVPVVELSDGGRWHCHISLDLDHRLPFKEFKSEAIRQWFQTDLAYGKTYCTKMYDTGYYGYQMKFEREVDDFVLDGIKLR